MSKVYLSTVDLSEEKRYIDKLSVVSLPRGPSTLLWGPSTLLCFVSDKRIPLEQPEVKY